jgi:hypothetical protein
MLNLLAGITQQQAGGAYTPDNVPDLAFWFDASDTGTITSTSGDVTALADKGPNGYNTFAAGNTTPRTGDHTRNSLNVLTWSSADALTHDAGSDVIDLAPFTACVVCYADALTSNFWRLLSSRRSATGAADFQSPNMSANRTNSTGSLQMTVAANGVSVASGYPTFSTATWVIVTVKATASGVSVQINQNTAVTASGTATIGLQRYLRLGNESTASFTPPGASNSGWVGRFGEWVGAAGDLTGSDLTDLQVHLAAKWGITL